MKRDRKPGEGLPGLELFKAKWLTTVINYTDTLNALHSPQVAHNWFCMLYLHIVHAAFDLMANQHWKRRINALISLSSRQHAVSLISIRYGNDLGTTGSQVDDRSVTILNNTERPVNVYVSVSRSKVNTDKDSHGPANQTHKDTCLYNTSWANVNKTTAFNLQAVDLNLSLQLPPTVIY